MNSLDVLAVIEAEIKSHQDALARLGRIRADIARQLSATTTPVIATVDSKAGGAIITTKQQNDPAASMNSRG